MIHRLKNWFPAILIALLLVSCSKDDANNGTGNSGNGNVNAMANQLPLGTSANDLLSDQNFTSLVVEVMYVNGFRLQSTTLNQLKTFLENRLNKPDGVTIIEREIPEPTGSPFTINEIVAIEDANRTLFNVGDEIAISILVINGNSSSDTATGRVLGTAYRNTSVVLYEENIKDLSIGPTAPNRIVLEATTINHEMGHIFGLVDLGTDTQSNHHDDAHPGHCTVNACLMFWQADGANSANTMAFGNNIPELDSQCIADLQANGGK